MMILRTLMTIILFSSCSPEKKANQGKVEIDVPCKISTEMNEFFIEDKNKIEYIKKSDSLLKEEEYGKAESLYTEKYKQCLNEKDSLSAGIILMGIGIVKARQKEFSDAIDILEKTLNFRKFMNSYQLTNLYFSLGRIHRLGEDYETALYYFTESIKQDSSFWCSYINRAYINHFVIENYEEALSDIKKAVGFKPELMNNDKILSLKGNSYLAAEKYKKAKEIFNEKIKLYPTDATGYYSRGKVNWKMKKFRKAIKDLTEAIELDSNYEEAYYYRAAVYDNIEKFNKAINDLSRAIEIDTGSYYSYYNRGILLVETGRFHEAIEDFTKAIEISPESFKSYHNRAHAYAKIGELEKAIEDLKKALELNPDSKKIKNKLKEIQQLKQIEHNLR